MSEKGISFTPELRDYLVAHSLPPTPQHEAITAATLEELPDWSLMQIPLEQAGLLTFLVRLVGAKVAVEVGTFTGSSALSIALGLPDDGTLIACDISDEWTAIGQPHWEAAGVAGRIDLRIGPASETLDALPDDLVVDFVFLDADKPGYVGYYEQLLPRMRSGGLIVADNVLFMGAVLDFSSTDENVVALRTFADHLHADDRVDDVMVNVADGLTLARVR